MQLCSICLLFPCSLAALHVSSDVIAHHQEHLSSYSFRFYSRVSLSAAVMAEQELSSYSVMTAADNDTYE
jgi:hypothetical protein